jgi:hypothetical protein
MNKEPTDAIGPARQIQRAQELLRQALGVLDEAHLAYSTQLAELCAEIGRLRAFEPPLVHRVVRRHISRAERLPRRERHPDLVNELRLRWGAEVNGYFWCRQTLVMSRFRGRRPSDDVMGRGTRIVGYATLSERAVAKPGGMHWRRIFWLKTHDNPRRWPNPITGLPMEAVDLSTVQPGDWGSLGPRRKEGR